MSTAEAMAGGAFAPADSGDLAPRPWARLWARTFDTQLEGGLIGLALGLIFPGPASAVLALPGGAFISALGLLPLSLVFDAVLLTLLGWTLGQAVVGIRVRTVGGARPGLAAALRRNALLYVRGMLLGIPILSLLGFWAGYRKVKTGQPTSWDRWARTQVVDRGVNARRVVLTGVAAFVVAYGMNVLDYLVGKSAAVTDGPAARESAPPAQAAHSDATLSVADHAELAAFAAKLNKEAPQQIDAVTRLDGVGYSAPEIALTYTYTLVQPDGRALPQEQMAGAVGGPDLQGKLTTSYCTSAEMEPFRQAAILFRYRYQDLSGSVVREITVTPDKCAALQTGSKAR